MNYLTQNCLTQNYLTQNVLNYLTNCQHIYKLIDQSHNYWKVAPRWLPPGGDRLYSLLPRSCAYEWSEDSCLATRSTILPLRMTKLSSPAAILRLLSSRNRNAAFLCPLVKSGEKYKLENLSLFIKGFWSIQHPLLITHGLYCKPYWSRIMPVSGHIT